MNALDLFIVLMVAVAAVGGHRLGFLGRAASWAGLVLGLYVAVRLLPRIVVLFDRTAPTTLAVIALATLVAGALVGQGIGLVVGSRLHRALPPGPLRNVDQGVGALVGALGVLVVLWLLVPSIAAIPGWPSREVSGSSISRWESDTLPPPPNTVEVLRRIIGDNAPQVFAALVPTAPAGPPPVASPFPSWLTTRLVASTVKVEGEACGTVYEGSGFAVDDNLVVTNAHVVAGEGRLGTQVLVPDGRTLPATVVMFDPRRDLALLAVPSLGESPLPLASPQTGMTGAVFGHPEGVDQTVPSPARVVRQERAEGFDIYDSHVTTRAVLILAAALAHGDSGGALIDASGEVVGVAFAIAANNADTGYALNSSEVRAALQEARYPAGVSTGPCLAS